MNVLRIDAMRYGLLSMVKSSDLALTLYMSGIVLTNSVLVRQSNLAIATLYGHETRGSHK